MKNKQVFPCIEKPQLIVSLLIQGKLPARVYLGTV